MSLVQASAIVKKAVIIFVALLCTYIFYLVVKNPLRDSFLALFPPDDLPDYGFGLLEPLEFTKVGTQTPFPNFKLFTKEGTLPTNFPSKLPVYKYFEPRYSFSEGERAQKDALLLGFDDTMRLSDLNASVFKWQDLTFGGNLEIDTKIRSIELDTPMSNIGGFYPTGKLTQTESIERAKELLTEMDRFSDKLYTLDTRGSQRVTFGKFGGVRTERADSILEAQIAKVEFFRKIFDYPILGPDPDEALLSITMRAPKVVDGNPQLNFPEVTAYHWEVNTEDSATYPLIPIQQAWTEVVEGNGIIANVTPSDATPFEKSKPVRVDDININDIFIAYYDNKKPQKYMQPIYVFKGNFQSRDTGDKGQITVYYPAIGIQYIKGPEAQPINSGQL